MLAELKVFFEEMSFAFAQQENGRFQQIIKESSGNGSILASLFCQAGNIESVKWLKELGFAFNEGAMMDAARGGHLDLIKWLRSEGCEWVYQVLGYAAAFGHLEVVKYLKENGCPYDESVIEYAEETGQHEVVEWLRQHC